MKFKAFGLVIESKDINLPEIPICSDEEDVDVRIIEEDYSKWPFISLADNDTNFVQARQNDLRLRVHGIGQFRATNGNQIFWCKDKANIPDSDIRNFLLGSVIGGILIQRDLLVLHANSLVKNETTIVCLGPSGSGKSTFAYALMLNGWKLLSDDLVALTKDFKVMPGIPRIKLWEDALDVYKIEKKFLTPIRRNLKKYTLKGENIDSASESQKVSAIYFLQRNRYNDNLDFKKISINKVNSQIEATIRLRNNLYRPRFVRGLGKESNIFSSLVNLQNQFPIYDMHLPDDILKTSELLIENNELQLLYT